MKVLMLSKEGDGLGMAHELAKEGHKVQMWIKDPKYQASGRGIVERIDSWRPYVAGADFVIGDMVGFGQYDDVFRRAGKPSIGFSLIADKIELDRKSGEELFKRAGIKVPAYKSFKTPEEAKSLLKEWKEPGYVIKPDGNISTSKTYVIRDKETFEWALTTYKPNQDLIVQQIVEGIEVSTEGWFNGRDWITPFNHTWEEKRFMEGGRGANTGCQGNVVLAVDGDKLTDTLLKPLTPVLRNVGFRGAFDVNAIVTEGEAFALEPSPRFGYDAIEALMEGLKEPVFDLLFETSLGVKKKMDVTKDYMISVRVSVPPWPMGKPESDGGIKGMPILGIDKENLKHIYFADVERKGDQYVCAGGDGVLLKVTAIGRDVREARSRAYRTVGNLKVMDKQFRDDIGSRVPGNMETLKKWGWISG